MVYLPCGELSFVLGFHQWLLRLGSLSILDLHHKRIAKHINFHKQRLSNTQQFGVHSCLGIYDLRSTSVRFSRVALQTKTLLERMFRRVI